MKLVKEAEKYFNEYSEIFELMLKCATMNDMLPALNFPLLKTFPDFTRHSIMQKT